MTNNGYGFYLSGVFLATGLQQISLLGQGSPLAESAGDLVNFEINGVSTAYTCTGTPVAVAVAPANPSFLKICNSVTVNGMYSKGVSLRPTNNITLHVEVTSLGNGEWVVETNTVDGIRFRGSGVFSTTGMQAITLLGQGTPTNSAIKTMTISSNSVGIDRNRTCTAVVNCVYTPKSIITLGNMPRWGGPSNLTYGYSANARAAYNMVISHNNFGLLTNSTVKIQGGLSISGMNLSGRVTLPSVINSIPTAATFRSTIATMPNPPDIIIIGWGMSYTAELITEFINYLNDGGVMIIMNKYSSTGTRTSTESEFFTALFGTEVTANTITDINGVVRGGGSSVGSLFRLASISGDPVLNGPFGNLNGELWGNDYFPATYMSGIPANQIFTYSGAVVNGSTQSTQGVTMFRHRTLNLFWVGDGGFLSNSSASGNVSTAAIMPFTTNSSHQPVPNPSFGSAVIHGGVNLRIHNSQLFANVLAWAIWQAENNGINAASRNPGTGEGNTIDP
jgi:hypothetical protein